VTTRAFLGLNPEALLANCPSVAGIKAACTSSQNLLVYTLQQSGLDWRRILIRPKQLELNCDAATADGPEDNPFSAQDINRCN
jgi:hypothetical protein